MTPEGKVKEQIKKLLKSYNIRPAASKEELSEHDPDANGWYYMPMKATAMGVNGIPDFIGCVRGLFVGIEAKAGKGAPTENQLRRIRGIQRGGGRAFVVSDVVGFEELEQWLKEVCGGTE